MRVVMKSIVVGEDGSWFGCCWWFELRLMSGWWEGVAVLEGWMVMKRDSYASRSNE